MGGEGREGEAASLELEVGRGASILEHTYFENFVGKRDVVLFKKKKKKVKN